MALGISHASTTTILRCQETERKALIEFKRLLRDPFDRLSSWVGEECCAWKGVGCSNTTGHVIKLDLRNRNYTSSDCDLDVAFNYYYLYNREDSEFGCQQALRGEISSSLLSLKHLTRLDLSGNHFGHPIPTFLGSLTTLTYLNLSSAGFLGRVPDQLGNLSSLNYLDLSYNYYSYSDHGGYSFSANILYLESSGWISRLSSLRLLNMSLVNFTGASNWLQAVNALPLIREIELGDCDLEDLPRSLPHSNFTSLTTLNLEANLITSTVPDWLLNITTLENLDLGGTGIYWYAPASAAKWTSLKALDLSANVFINDDFLQGALFHLCTLRSLHLRGVTMNDVMSKLEVAFSGCLMFSLEELNLSDNQLNGSLPRWFGNMKNLIHLDLSYNSFYGSLPASLGNLSSLQYFSLRSNNFNGTIAQGSQLDGSFSDWLGNMKNLEILDLSYNSFYGQLPPSLGNLSSLQYLYLQYNDLIWSVTQDIQLNDSFLDWFGRMKKLKILDLSFNSLFGSLPASLGNLSSLRHLDLHSNNLNGSIGEGIPWLKGLISLDLGNNSLNLFEAHFANLSSLKYLDISYNTLVSKEGSHWTPLFQLTTLCMSFCRIMPIPYFPQWLRTQMSLIELYIENVGIKGMIPNWLPPSLERLYLSSNEIRGDLPQYFPNLKFLDLSNNSFSGQIPQRMGDMMQNLERLDISYNKLTGEVPSYFSKLRYLDLSNNLFSGYLPPRISHTMPKLSTLDLSMNNLIGSIPLSFCQNKFLYMIQLSNNSLSGEIPNCWMNSSNVFFLDFSNNQLQGRIPDTICNMQSLLSLHLSNNNLSGVIPLSLRNCTSLVTLDLGHNSFTGNIPAWLEENLLHLKTLNLRSNAFTGHIPGLSQLAYLQILDISNNHLLGCIPYSFGNFSALKSSPNTLNYFKEDEKEGLFIYYDEDMQLFLKGLERGYGKLLSLVTLIDLSNNDLSGYIPEELENLHGLHNLNLSGNHLVGEIPKNISKIKLLETLDLSRNNLSGEIPSSLAVLNFLSQLNLSYNNLSGRIPTGSQFQTFNDPSIYNGNPYLCGPPLTKNCTDDAARPNVASGEDEVDQGKIEFIWLYSWAVFGFIVGFWIICGTLLLKKRWRIIYFRSIDDAYDWLYAMVAVSR